MNRNGRRALVSTVAVLFLAGCGGSRIVDGPGGSLGDLLDASVARDPAPVVVVTTAGVLPQVSHLDHGTPVTFRNEDAVAHELSDALDLGYGPCPEVRGVRLDPGQQQVVTIGRSGIGCAFHEVTRPGERAFQGLLVVH